MYLDALDIRKDKIKQFEKKGITSVEELASFLPRKYHDFTQLRAIRALEEGQVQVTQGVITKIDKHQSFLKFEIRDMHNWRMWVTIFSRPFLLKVFQVGDPVVVGGVVQYQNGKYRAMTNPLLFTNKLEQTIGMYPIYSAIQGMSDKYLKEKINLALDIIEKDDYLEHSLRNKYALLPTHKSIRMLHQPATQDELDAALKRKLFDELFQFHFKLRQLQHTESESSPVELVKMERTQQLIQSLPFELTEGQRGALRNLARRMKSQELVHALVQGDVGCGKTLVAFLLMAYVAENGYQCCLVAPTNILAKQHYKEACERLEPLGYRIGFLSGEQKKREQNKVLKAILSGEIDIVIGTHTVMSKRVIFANLGLAIIDEEHRFGVKQRDRFNQFGVHKVSMSATPIPRSLALSLFGEQIVVETIQTLPKGRQPIATHIEDVDATERVYAHVCEQLKQGRQAYIVCPLIQESESETMSDVSNVQDVATKAQSYFGLHGFKVGVVTGSMDEESVEEQLTAFRNHECDVLVATTIIEVGVNVPNATAIVIQNAERFGFAQLHQLRGRVGRGSYQSACYLLSKNKEKLQIFGQTTDGFAIAEADLRLRGAGSFLGTSQSGSNKFLMLTLAHKALTESIRADITEIFQDEKRLRRYTAIKELQIDELG